MSSFVIDCPSIHPSIRSIQPHPGIDRPHTTKASLADEMLSNCADCPAFRSDEERDAFAASIAPRRELVCPITQECFVDPCVADDGNTYERKSILTWFHCGKTRSPVTNEILKNRNLVPNRNISAMALAHREKLGADVLQICRRIRQQNGRCEDNGDRLNALLDAGADPAIRDTLGKGETSLHHLICAGRADLANLLLRHNVSVLPVDEEGQSAADVAQKMRDRVTSDKSISEWVNLTKELRRRATVEKEQEEARTRARQRSNEEHRERQRELAEAERDRNRYGTPSTAGGTVRGSLGSLEEGWGYFPSLSALQFQGSIPPPSPSIAIWERREKRRLNLVLKSVAAVVVLYLFLC